MHFFSGTARWHLGIEMTGYPIFRNRLWYMLHRLWTRILGRLITTIVFVAGFGGALYSIPAGSTLPIPGLADVITIPAMLDLSECCSGLLLMLCRRLCRTSGD